MKMQNVKGGQVIHVDISRFCSHRPEQRRTLIYECHLHKAVWHQRLQLAMTLIFGRAIHLKLGGAALRVGDREVSEIEL